MARHTYDMRCAAATALAMLCLDQAALGKPEFREAFFAAYPGAVNTVLDTVPSFPNHCGVCHFDFAGGARNLNPYGKDVGEAFDGFPENPDGWRDAILSIGGMDSDHDGSNTFDEVTGTDPTFPGLTPANVVTVSVVNLADIRHALTPGTDTDTTPPLVALVAPNGGETFTGNQPITVEWMADDALSGVAFVDIYVDYGNGFKPLARGLANRGNHTGFLANRPTGLARVRVVATDNGFNSAFDESDAVFSVVSPPGGRVPTTLRDFDMPGSQPLDDRTPFDVPAAALIDDPTNCRQCHGEYDPVVEPFFTWEGSLMSQASRDPLFLATMAVANQDAPDSGDLCLRCHFPRGWLDGRSVPTTGSAMLPGDKIGVACDVCHRLVDPIFEPGENPAEDGDILADLELPGTEFGNGMYVIDPVGRRRGPFVDAVSGHAVLVSPFHREAALCGACHDVSNPAFANDGSGNYPAQADTLDAPATDFSVESMMPVERTYSEWYYSAYNSPQGIFAPQFGGNRDFVATCQDCHMRDVTGRGAKDDVGSAPRRHDLPLHDLTGGSTWLPTLFAALYPGEVDATAQSALDAGVIRARYMLQNAAELTASQEGTMLKVTVTNNTGHKLPTGYPEGRRLWLTVKFFDAGMTLISESGTYDRDTGVLTAGGTKIYEVLPGLASDVAALTGLPEGKSFHFVLNNTIVKDNRIPPQGFRNDEFASFGGRPVGAVYADGQYWDDTFYDIPANAASAEVTLFYQSTSKELIEFLRDENRTNNMGQIMFDLWNDNGKSPPETMAGVELALAQPGHPVCDANGPYTAACAGVETMVQLDASGSFEPGGDPMTFLWTNVDCPGASFDDATSDVPMLTIDTAQECQVNCTVMLTVTAAGAFEACEATVTITDVIFPGCMAGPNVEASQLCRTAFDFDVDTDVDFRDFATFQEMFDGFREPGTP